MLDVDCLDFAYPAKNSFNADFTEAKRNRQDVIISVVFCF